MERLTEVVLRHRRKVVIGWVAVLLAAIAAMGPATDSLSESFSSTGEGFETNQQILEDYGTGGQMPPIVPVVTLPEGTTVDSPEARAELASAFDRIQRAVPDARVASYASTGDRAFVSEDGRTTFGLVYPEFSGGFEIPEEEAAVEEAVEGVSVAGAPVQVTGFFALQGGAEEDEGPALLLEVLIGGTGALVILTLLFGIRLALLPLLMAIFSIPTTFLLLWPIASITDVSIIVQFLLALIGLGVAIDYALLVVMRWREERGNGRENVDAVRVSMRTAGKAVVFSGTTVAIGLLAMVALPVPTLRSIGYGGLLIPLVSVAVALTLLPVLLATIGPRLDRSKHATRAATMHGRWFGWAEWIVRHRWIAAGVSVALLLALAIPSLSMQLGSASAESLAGSGPAREGFDNLQRSSLGQGAMAPFEVVAPAAQAEQVAADLAKVDGVVATTAPEDWSGGGTRIVGVVPAADPYSNDGAAILDRVRAVAPPGVAVGGSGPENADFVDAVYDNAPLMIGLVLLLTFLLLARALRSLALPLKAVLLNLISLAAAIGFMVLVWQEGYGSEAIWGIEATGAVESWIPIMVFAFLFGLSMDYEVFILSRMREEYDRTGSTREAVVGGLGHTGRLVTSAALILFFAFAALASAPDTITKMFATSLAAGILLDATLIRGLLVPAVVSLMGRWNWWLPALPARLLRTKPSPQPPLQPAREEA
ncbi:MAG: MMPL family transporter [Thermoleophilaceae bacterium]